MYNFISADYITPEKGLLDQLFDRKIDGIVLRGFLSQARCKDLAYRLRTSDRMFDVHGSYISTFPMAFSQAAQMMDQNDQLDLYFHECSILKDRTSEYFGDPIVQEIECFLSSSTYFEQKSVSGINGLGSLPTMSFRILEKNKGSLKPHCENYFFNEFSGLFEQLEIRGFLNNPISFFLVIQKPQKGGKLKLYPFEWDSVKERIDDKTVVDDNGNRINLLEIDTQLIEPSVGDLVVFNGGKIWHEVEPPIGDLDRITIGGFISRDVINKRDYLWS